MLFSSEGYVWAKTKDKFVKPSGPLMRIFSQLGVGAFLETPFTDQITGFHQRLLKKRMASAESGKLDAIKWLTTRQRSTIPLM